MAVFLGAIPTALAYVLFARGLRHLTPGETATLTLAEPLTATGARHRSRWASAPARWRSIGAGLVLAGLLALALPAQRRLRTPGRGAGVTQRLTLNRISTVDALAAALRTRILDGELAAGERLRELELADAYGVARHTLRAALRALAAEGLVTIEPNRGARVASLTHADLDALFELRTALELEAARLALERGGGRLPKAVHDAVRLMAAVCAQHDPPWSAVVDAHDRVHGALVAAARSPRIERSYAALAGELRLFLIQLKPSWSLERMAEHHERLLADLERQGPDPLRAHLAEGRASVSLKVE